MALWSNIVLFNFFTSIYGNIRPLWIWLSVAFLLVGVPIHVNRMLQLGINCDLSGRGVLRLTVMEQKFFLLSGVSMILQILVLLEAFPANALACRAMCFFIMVVNVVGTTGGTSIAVCR